HAKRGKAFWGLAKDNAGGTRQGTKKHQRFLLTISANGFRQTPEIPSDGPIYPHHLPDGNGKTLKDVPISVIILRKLVYGSIPSAHTTVLRIAEYDHRPHSD